MTGDCVWCHLSCRAVAEAEIAVSISDEELAALDRAISEGLFASRSDAIRHALRAVLTSDAETGIAGSSDIDESPYIDESYRRAYGDHPEEDWVGQVGLRLAGERVRRDREGREPTSG